MHKISNLAKRALMFAVAMACFVGLSAESRVHVTPAEGVVDELSEFIITFDGNWGLGSRRSARFTVTGPEGVTIPPIQAWSMQVSYNVGFADDAVLRAPGTYTFTIPAGRFAIDNVDLEEMTFTYVIEAPDENAYTGNVSIDPVEGTYEAIDMWLLEFDDDVEVVNGSMITLKSTDGEDVPLYVEADENYLQILPLTDDYMLTANGEYSLVIAAGALAIDNKPNARLAYRYTIGNDMEQHPDLPPYAIEPAPGTYAAINDAFRLTFNTDEEITVAAGGVFMTSAKGDLDLTVEVPRGMPYIIITPVDANGVHKSITDAGDYTLIFTMGAVHIGDATNSEPLVFNYSVTGQTAGNWTGEITATPADGSDVAELKEIDLTFVGAGTVTVKEFASPNEFPALYEIDTNDEVTRASAFADANILMVSLFQTVYTGGSYKLVIPKTFITVDGIALSEDIELTYTIVPPAAAFEYSYEMSPAAGSYIGPDDAVTITFSGDAVASVENNSYAWGNTAPHFTNDFGGYNPPLIVARDGMSFTFSHQWPFEQDGVYTLVIPAGYFTLADSAGATVSNDPIKVPYNVSVTAIDAVSVDASATEVYTITGIRVKGALLPGIYIVGGRKMYVK